MFCSDLKFKTYSNILPEQGIYLYTRVLNLLQYSPRTRYLSLYQSLWLAPIYFQNLVLISTPEYWTYFTILLEPGIYLYIGLLNLLQYTPRKRHLSLYQSLWLAPIYFQNLVLISIPEYWTYFNILLEPGIYLYTGVLNLLQYTPRKRHLTLYQSLYSQNKAFISIPEYWTYFNILPEHVFISIPVYWTYSNILPEPGIYLYTGVLYLLQYTPRTWYLSLYRSIVLAPIYSQNLVYISIPEYWTCSNILPQPDIYLYIEVLKLLQYTTKTWYLSLYRSIETAPIYSQNLVFISIPENCTCSNILPEPGIYLYTRVLSLLQYTPRTWYLSLYRSLEPAPIYSQNLIFISIPESWFCSNILPEYVLISKPEYWTCSNILLEPGIYLYNGVLNLLQ